MPKQVNHADRRRELIEASWRVIAREGLDGMTLRKVAEVAGCTTGRIVHYFADRDALILAALRAANQATADRMTAIAGSDLEPKQRLLQVGHEALPLDDERLDEWKVWIVFWTAALTNPLLADENQARYRAWRALLRKLVAEVAATDVDTHTDNLMALIDGLGLRTSLAPTEANRRQATAHMAGWIQQL